MDAFRLDFERSLALHVAVAAKLRDHPEILARARANLDRWLAEGGRSAPLLERWREILARPAGEVAAFLTDRSEQAAWLRKASPFAGVLTPQERWRIRREVRDRLESAG
jgi:hypothetical protein